MVNIQVVSKHIIVKQSNVNDPGSIARVLYLYISNHIASICIHFQCSSRKTLWFSTFVGLRDSNTRRQMSGTKLGIWGKIVLGNIMAPKRRQNVWEIHWRIEQKMFTYSKLRQYIFKAPRPKYWRLVIKSSIWMSYETSTMTLGCLVFRPYVFFAVSDGLIW